ncbi:MAG: 30S ribosomal protein S16 [FCB group bacterium]|nr:30S ribosomal protein S16 [FCB group bacterium]
MGKKGEAFFRIVVADRRKAPTGKFIEELGYYDPLRQPMSVKYNEERIFFWLQRGAQVSDTVKSILKKFGTWSKWTKLSAAEEGIVPEEIFEKGRSVTSS